MTTRNIEIRKKEHLKTYNDSKSRMYNFKIYQAMRKYGFENFEFAVLEECEDNELEFKERYYIELFDTVQNGYNEALGGKGKPLWTDKQVYACKILYENGWLLQDIASIFQSNPRTVSKKLKEKYNLDTRKNSIHSFSKPIIGIEKDYKEVEFNSLSNAARYILSSGKTKSNKIETVISKIETALHNTNKSAYGYKWKYKTF